MSLLLHAGIGIEDGLYLLIEDEKDKKSKKMLEQLADLVTEGKPFSEAVREVGTFPKYVGDMIETGEETGRLEQSFQALADYYDRQQQLMSQIRSALLYPFILMILMLVILVVLLVKVLPIFNQVYEQLGGTMGGTAKLLLRFGDWLGSIMPVFGGHGIVRRMGEARFASAMAMGMMSGLNTEDAFRTAMLFQDVNQKTKKRYEKCLEMLEVGEPMAKSFRENEVLEASFCRILDLGAKSGTSDTAMAEISRRMDDRVQLEIARKVGKIEPTIVIITSILVGIVLITVMLPLIHIMSSIG